MKKYIKNILALITGLGISILITACGGGSISNTVSSESNNLSWQQLTTETKNKLQQYSSIQ